MNFSYPLILASSSPRRQYLLKELGFQFELRKPSGDESFSESIPVDKVPEYLALKKVDSVKCSGEEVVMTADTAVILGGQILNKPADRKEAIEMLTRLSGKTHTVITAVCLKSLANVSCFNDKSEVTFKSLSQIEIENYVDHFKPFDKAGAYGAQDCLPKGVNPCSREEMDFLKKINKVDLVEKTFTNPAVGTGMHAIERIEGSYFNVMGLPIHKVYTNLEAL